MREKLATNICKNENGGEFLLKYYLTSKESEKENTFIYGIEIEKYEKDKTGEERFAESSEVDDLSYAAEDVRGIIEKIAEGAVSPVSLVYILDDMCA